MKHEFVGKNVNKEDSSGHKIQDVVSKSVKQIVKELQDKGMEAEVCDRTILLSIQS
ncbi:hypothetical protein [Halalkalibacter hemicellulosilyticus]|uniref:Uncharacterized protein n=1 Tax=Halalkalibacter hemicellulosilyticusJCM 9152 TaxID=1236971 RepID=W4QER8_9BACI|nr:hypothetical protein [Halalkalibacter hemicellulosilyticus]GAE29844.1 hypothetical protein JCM9152_1230 [Halalkalibacter hemicellulosilyticusJCM 9152]